MGRPPPAQGECYTQESQPRPPPRGHWRLVGKAATRLGPRVAAPSCLGVAGGREGTLSPGSRARRTGTAPLSRTPVLLGSRYQSVTLLSL